MERPGSAAIPGLMIRSVRDQKLCYRTPKRGGSHMQGRVAAVKIMVDLVEKEIFGIFAAGTNFSRSSGKSRIGHYLFRHRTNVTADDVSNEF